MYRSGSSFLNTRKRRRISLGQDISVRTSSITARAASAIVAAFNSVSIEKEKNKEEKKKREREREREKKK